ncbi:MAG: hypothetical protein K5872_22670 [Rhizobiaceae bacterium]|nr:hypothetical protein [Rhizobiaceae bacterium]MCV0409026.1 hypothetical protein [Rhizobiaceae bacterium]
MATTAGKATKPAGEAATNAELEAQIETLREELAKVTAQLQSSSERSYGAAKRAAELGMDRIKQRGESAIDGLRTNAHDIEDQVVEHVREKPITSLAIAAGVGFLFALIANR